MKKETNSIKFWIPLPKKQRIQKKVERKTPVSYTLPTREIDHQYTKYTICMEIGRLCKFNFSMLFHCVIVA